MMMAGLLEPLLLDNPIGQLGDVETDQIPEPGQKICLLRDMA